MIYALIAMIVLNMAEGLLIVWIVLDKWKVFEPPEPMDPYRMILGKKK